MKQFMILALGLSFAGLGFFTPSAQAVEINSISLEEAYERLGKRGSGRIGLSAYTRSRNYRNPGKEKRTNLVERRRSLNIAPRKASRKGVRRFNTTTRARLSGEAEDLTEFYNRPRYLRR